MRPDRLKAVRVRNGYTQEALALELATDKKQVSRWEGGIFTPNTETLIKIAQLLQVSTDYLLGLSDDPTPDLRVDNLSDDERSVLKAMRRGDDKEAIKIIASR